MKLHPMLANNIGLYFEDNNCEPQGEHVNSMLLLNIHPISLATEIIQPKLKAQVKSLGPKMNSGCFQGWMDN